MMSVQINVFSLGKYGLRIVLFCFALVSCGIPSVSNPPAQPSITASGQTVYISLDETDIDTTQGIVILYKFYSSTSTYETQLDTMESYTSGNTAYSSMLNLGFETVYNYESSTLVTPTISFSDDAYSTIFTTTALAAGLESSSGGGIKIEHDSTNGAVLSVFSGTTVYSEITLAREPLDDEGYHLSFIDDEVSYDDDDVSVGSAGTSVYLVFAAFGYRSTFEDGTQFSLPGLLPSADNIIITTS